MDYNSITNKKSYAIIFLKTWYKSAEFSHPHMAIKHSNVNKLSSLIHKLAALNLII